MHAHLRGATLPVAPQLLLGRGVASCPDDPYLSRQTCVLAYDQATATASVTWMGRQCGALCSRQIAVGSAYAGGGPLQTQVLKQGSQHRLNDGDLIILLGQSGRHTVLIGLDGRSSRPSGREWAALEASALAVAEHAARAELDLKAAQAREQQARQAAARASRATADAALLAWRRDAGPPDSDEDSEGEGGGGGRAGGRGGGIGGGRITVDRVSALGELVTCGVPMADAIAAVGPAAVRTHVT